MLVLCLFACNKPIKDIDKTEENPTTDTSDSACMVEQQTSDGLCIPDAEDDEITTATPLTDGKGFGVIGPDTDVDWWRFEVEEESWWTLQAATGSDDNFDLVLQLFNPEGELWNNRPYTDFYLNQPGTWSISVSDAGGGGDEDFYYSFEMAPTTGISTLEPDDVTPNLLLDLNHTYEIRATASSPEDVDRIAIHIPEKENQFVQHLDISENTSYVSGKSPRMRILDTAGTPLASYSSLSGTILSGDYILEIATGASGGDGFLSVSSSTLLALQEGDYNDTQAWATPAAFFSGRIVVEGDEDWWLLPGSGLIEPATVDCSVPIGSTLQDLHIEINDQQGQTQCAGDWRVQCTPTTTDGFGIRLTSVTPGAQAWYVCSATWPPAPDDGSGD